MKTLLTTLLVCLLITVSQAQDLSGNTLVIRIHHDPVDGPSMVASQVERLRKLGWTLRTSYTFTNSPYVYFVFTKDEDKIH